MVKELSKQGYTLKDCCNAVGLSRSRYYSFNRTKENKQAQRIGEVQLCSRIKAIKTEHPFWGYRRVTAWLRHREGIIVNHKTVRKIMKENGLTAGTCQFTKQREKLKEGSLKLRDPSSTGE